jgi:hypothetical protein
MNKEFIPYDRALKLKKLGFDESCLSIWNNIDGELNFLYVRSYHWNDDLNELSAVAPTFSQAFRWFREEYNLFGCIDLHVSNPIHWFIRIDNIEINDYLFHSEDENIYFTTYEEAELACLDKLIELVEGRES